MIEAKIIKGDRLIFQSVANTKEQAELDVVKKAWTDDAPNRRRADLRKKRDALLVETDWMANSDVTMTDAWKTYRQALRDITNTYKSLTDVKWPTEPTS